jgi:hypothetical protein
MKRTALSPGTERFLRRPRRWTKSKNLTTQSFQSFFILVYCLNSKSAKD